MGFEDEYVFWVDEFGYDINEAYRRGFGVQLWTIDGLINCLFFNLTLYFKYHKSN